MKKAIKENWKRWITSTIITFFSGFCFVLLAKIDSIDVYTLETGAIVGIIVAAIRAGLKAVVEAYLLKYPQKKGK